MTQILVTLNEDVTTQHVRKAIELLRGVVSTTVFKTKGGADDKTIRQQTYVKESLERAFDEVKRARRGEHKLMTDEEFIKKLQAEGIA
jgi:DNA replicative helicase MCM subunit Mcm2 (Cdc46/Mcm family)